ncbi:type II toxin-antitoxin system RelE family toxin [Lunatimonas salinarum]|uniref:type II toxin-antitoxin system RelE family toxin n=1 Tax=Lunatimonas salinarum TaxID=1774590 RepID=UPI001ADFDDE3|nr:type II toxin-antitoxin system RelE/ParE family toxin [Lunatimonas salinarum]
MNQYEITVTKSAAKELSKLPKQVNNKLIEAILALSGDPRPAGAIKLRGGSENWRIRVGDYRVVYAIDDEVLVVDVRKVGHRKDIYD